MLNLGDSRTILEYGKGTYLIISDVDGRTQPISLPEVLYLPDLAKNSLGACKKLGATVMIEDGVCKTSRNSKMLAVVAMIGKLYVLKVVADEHVIIGMDESSLKLWHYWFCYLGMDNVMKLVNGKMVQRMDNASDQT